MPIQPIDINRTFAYGKEGTIEMKPIDEVAQSTLAAVPQSVQQQPGIDPNQVVQTKLTQLKANFKQKVDNLEAANLDPEDHNKILAGWQGEYDQAKSEIIGVKSQLGLIQQGAAAQEMTPEAAREASLRMILPRETVDLMFPSVQQEPKGYLGPQARQYLVDEFEDVFAMAAAAARPGESYNPDVLAKQYVLRKQINGYGQHNSTQKLGYDTTWDESISLDPKLQKAWEEAQVKIKALEADTPITRAAAKKVLGKPVSPLSQSIQAEIVRGQRGGQRSSQQGSQSQKPIYQQNKNTGQKRVSYDGGQTWQIVQ